MMSVLRQSVPVFRACGASRTSVQQRSASGANQFGWLLLGNNTQYRNTFEQQQQIHQQQHRGMASNRSERLTVREKKKTSRALARARRARSASIATVLGEEEWTGYEATMRQGLRELDDASQIKRERRTHASKPLVSAAAASEEEEGEDGGRLSQRDAWAESMEDVWNEVLLADSRRGRPVVTLPGFPIHVVMVKIARDYGHQKIFWELSDFDTRPPAATLRQLYKARQDGFSARAVVLKSTIERLRRGEGYLRSELARRVPMRRVPEVRWLHVSEMPLSLRIELMGK